MPTDKRARQRANRQLKLDNQEQQERRDQVRHYGFIATLIGVVAVAAIALFAIAGGDGETDADEAASQTDQGDPATETDEAAAAQTDQEDPAAETAEADAGGEPTPCPAEDGSSERVVEFPAPPPDCLVDGATYTAVFDTSAGEMTVDLDSEQAPLTVNNFVYLARYHYYDDTTFHRVIENFVIQGGDPTGDPPGTGGPGYTIGEEAPAPDEYQVGSLVMAKRDPPGTTGAQFFIVTGPDGEALPNLYSLFGQVTEGLDVATSIQSVETGAGDLPVEDVVINSITIVQS